MEAHGTSMHPVLAGRQHAIVVHVRQLQGYACARSSLAGLYVLVCLLWGLVLFTAVTALP